MNQAGPQPPVLLSCHKHQELIKGVCLHHDSCNERLLCKLCRKDHNNNHLNSYEEFDDLLNGNLAIDLLRTFEEMTKRIDEQSQSSAQNVEVLTAHINGLFHEAQNYMVGKLLEARDKIFEDIQAKFCANSNLKQKIRSSMEEVHKTYTMAANSGFKPLFVIENLIQVIRQAHVQKQRIIHDPEMNIHHGGDMITGYLSAMTSGSLFQQIQNSFEKLCEDIVESFVLRKKNEKSISMPDIFQQESNRLFHNLAQPSHDITRGLQAFPETMNLEDPQASLFAETASFLNKYNPLANLDVQNGESGFNFTTDYSKGLAEQLQHTMNPDQRAHFQRSLNPDEPYPFNQDTAEAPHPSMQVEHEAKKKSASPGTKHTPSHLLQIFERADQEAKASSKGKTLSDLFPVSQSERERQISPAGARRPEEGRRRTEILESVEVIPTSHKQIMFGGMTYLKQGLATAGQEGEIKIWDISRKEKRERECKHTIKAHDGEIFRLLYIAEKDLLVSSGADGNICVWNCAKDFAKVRTYNRLRGPVYALEYLPDLGMVACGGEDGQLCLWDTDSKKEFPAFGLGDLKIGSLCYMRKLKKIAIGLNNGEVFVANVNAHAKRIEKDFAFDAHSSYVLNLAFIEEYSQLVTGAEEGPIKIWKVAGEGRGLVRDFGDKKTALRSMAVISEKDLILSNHNGNVVRVWKISTGEKITEYSDSSFGECIIGIKNKNKVITANHNEVKLWNLNY